ncbi:hypothetical protein ACLOJK_023671 [Asimina triloba]
MIHESRKNSGKVCERFSEVMPGALEELIGNINESEEDDGKIRCIISDGNMAGAVMVGRKMGIPTAFLWPCSASTLAIVTQIPRLIQDGTINLDGRIDQQSIYSLDEFSRMF